MDSNISMGIAIALLILLSAFFSAMETAFSFVNKIRIQHAVENGDKKAAKVLYVIEHFDKALTAIGTAPYYAELAEATSYCFHQFLTQGGDIRRVGSAAIDCCDVACGRSDIFCELRLSPWDFAAGALLIMEAGGSFMMPYEPEIDFGKPACILAANPACRKDALRIVQEAKKLIKQ